MIIGISSCPTRYVQPSSRTSTNSSGTDSKNMAVESCMPAMPMPADTLNCAGVKAPVRLANGCASMSAMSPFENVPPLLTRLPSVLTFLLTIT